MIPDNTTETPPTPRPEPEDSSDCSESTEREHNRMSGRDDQPFIVVGTIKQRQAAAINNILSKISVKKPLDNLNWYQWSDGVRMGLAGAMFDGYLKSDSVPNREDSNLHSVIQICIVTWLTANMTQAESDRALSYITTYSSITREKEIDYKPVYLWEKMKGYHASQSIEKRKTLRDNLDETKQGISKDLLKHIDEWSLKLKNLLDAQEPMTPEEQAGRLARSLNQRWREKATDYIGSGYTNLDSLIQKLKVTYELRDSINNPQSSSQNNSNRTEETCHHHQCDKTSYRRMRCTPRKCDGGEHHLTKDCFKLPQNAHKLREWEDEKKNSGKWRGYNQQGQIRGRGRGGNSSHLTSVRTYSNNIRQDASSDEFLESLLNLRIEDREMTYNIELDGKYPCSASVQTVAHHLGKCLKIGLLDTGSSHFMMNDENMFVKGSITPNHDPKAVLRLAGGNATLPIKGFGQYVQMNSRGERIVFNDVLYAPDLNHNLLAGGRLVRAGVTTELLKDLHFRLVDRKKEVFVGSFVGEGSLPFVQLNPVSQLSSCHHITSQVNKRKLTELAILKFHYSLGHPGKEYCLKMWRSGLTGKRLPDGVKTEDFDVINKCRICPLAKNHKLPFKGHRTRSKDYLENVHLDLSGIFQTPSTEKNHYYVLFTDDYSAFRVVYGSKAKDAESIFDVFKTYLSYVERHTERKLKMLSIDGGGEFLNELFAPFCAEKGIVLRVTAPHTPQQNGVAERANRTIASKARAMLIQSGLGTKYWYRAVHHTVFLDNRTVSSSLSYKTPHEIWYRRKPTFDHIQPFGCLAYRLIRKELRGGKLEPVSSPSILVGIEEHNHNYHLLDLETLKIIITHDATFQPLIFPARKASDNINPDWDLVEEESIDIITHDENETGPDTIQRPEDENTALPPLVIPAEEDRTVSEEKEVDTLQESPKIDLIGESDEGYDQEITIEITPPVEPLRKSNRNRQQPQRFTPGSSNVQVRIEEPNTYKNAMKSPQVKEWREACLKEVRKIEEMGVWDIVDRPRDAPVVGGRWHFKIKYNPDGSVAKFKARYIAKGFTQTEGVDYTETFAPTGRLASLRALIAVAASRGWEIHTMDAIAAFLNSILKETIYMELPEGNFDKERAEGKVARLRRALYGLKQSAKCWSDEIKDKFTAMGMEQNPLDPCLWYRKNEKGEILLYLHLDDMAITGNCISSFKEEVNTRWKMEDLGYAHQIVGIEIHRSEDGGYEINQPQMINSVVEKFRMTSSKPTSTPFPGGVKVYKSTDSEAEEMASKKLPYRSVVGSLMYIAISTRPDISYAVGVLSQHLERPSLTHWNLAMHVIRYLSGTKTMGIRYHTGDNQVNGLQSWYYPQCHVDSDWAGDPNSRRSTTGYLFTLNGGAISWKSSLQPTVSLSSTEAEYRATTEAGQEVVWLRNLLKFINIKHPTPTVLCCDNKGAVDLTRKTVFHGRTKHIEVQYHWIREQVEKGTITLRQVSTENMMADILTKALHPQDHGRLKKMAGMRNIE